MNDLIWITNISDEQLRAKPDWMLKDYIVSLPKATTTYTVKELQEMLIVGVYRRRREFEVDDAA